MTNSYENKILIGGLVDNLKLVTGNSQRKILLALFLLLITFFTTSCGALMQDSGDMQVRISLPPIDSQSRSIAVGRIPHLQTAIKRYRVTVNGMEREGTESVYEFTLPVGAVANVVVECLNGSGQVIVRAEKSFRVASGENVFSIVLKDDGNEIINTSVSYSSGVASTGVSDIPAAVNVATGEKFTVSTTQPAWNYGNFTGWKTNVELTGDTDTQTPDVQAGGNVRDGGTYIMPDGSITLTAQWNPTSYTISYVTNNNTQVTPSPGVQGATSFTMENNAASGALSTYTDGGGNYNFLGWSATDGANSPNISSIADIRAAVANGSLQINNDATSTPSVKLYSVWQSVASPPVPSVAAYINDSPYDDFNAAWTQANNTANCVLKLAKNVEITSMLQVTSPFTLDLNGFVIDGGSATNLINVKANFTVKDDSTNKDGQLTGGSYGNGGAVIVNSGTANNYITFTLESGNITGNNSNSGGNVYLNSYAEFIMNGGRITNNDSGDYSGGAAVYMSNNAKFTMTGGDITGNRSASNGGAIYCNGTGAVISIEGGTISGNTATSSGGGIYLLDGTLTVKGGQISGNKAGTSGGGIYVGNSNSITFNISGNINILGNKQSSSNSSETDSNVYLNGLAKINVTGSLNTASRIGVRLADYSSITPTAGRTITSGISGNGTADNFTDDYESVAGQGRGWQVAADDNGEIALKQR